jgi:hypothetical protein
MKTKLIWITVGASVGLLLWLYDYDFLLNVGGPETPISDYLRSIAAHVFRTEPYGSTQWYVYYFSPLPFLMVAGSLTGYVMHLVVKTKRHRATA